MALFKRNKKKKKKKKKKTAVSSRALRNEKARQANAGRPVKQSSTTTSSRRTPSRSSRTMGNNKGLFGDLFDKNKDEKKKSTTSRRSGAASGKDSKSATSAVARRAGLTQQDYKQVKKKTENRKKGFTGILQEIVGGHAKGVGLLAGYDKQTSGRSMGKYGNPEDKVVNSEKRANKISDWGTKQIEKGNKKYNSATKDLGKVGKFGADVAKAGIGFATDAAAGPLAPVMMFSRSFGSAANTAQREGATDEQAAMYGLVSGALELATERIGSVAKPLHKIYGKGVADDFVERVARKKAANAKTQVGRDLAYHGSKTAAAVATEALEEMIAEGLDPAIANEIYAREIGKEHSTSAKDILYAGAVGGALGGILGAGGQVVEYNSGAQVRDIYGEDGMKQWAKVAKESDDDGDAMTAEALDKIINEGGGIAAGQALQLKKAVEKQNAKDRERIQIINDSARNVMRDEGLVDIIRKIDEDGTLDLSDNTRTVYEGAKAKATEIADVITPKDGQNQLKDITVDEITSEVASIVTGAVTDIDTVNMFTTSNTLARKIYEQTTGETLPATNKETRDYLYEKIALNRKLMAESETSYSIDKIKGGLQQDIAQTYDAHGQTGFSNVMKNVDVRNWRQVEDTIVTFENYYEAGRAGISLQKMADLKNPVHDILTPQQKVDAYNAGVQDSIGARNFAAERAKDIKLALGQKVELNQSQVKSVAPRGKVIYEFEDVDNKTHFTASQQTMFQTLAREFNINIHVTDNPDYNGNYVDGEMWMSVNADRNMKYVFGHEITHHLEKFAPEEYNDFKELLRTAWGPENLNAAIRAKQAHYAKHGVNLSREAALDEILADSTYEMIQDPAFVTELCNEDRGLAKRILDSLRNLIAKIRAMLAGNDFTPAQNEGLLSQLDILKEAERLWEIGLKKAAENRDAVGMVETDGETQYQFAGYAEDGRGIYVSDYKKGVSKDEKAKDILDLIANLWSKKPIELVVKEAGKEDRVIEAKFDPYYEEGVNTDAGKIAGGNTAGTRVERRVNLNIGKDYYQILSESEYTGTNAEDMQHDTSDTHKEGQIWHYFLNQIYYKENADGELEPYTVFVNVRENKDGSFVYGFETYQDGNVEKAAKRKRITLTSALAETDDSANSSNSSTDIISDSSENSNKKFSFKDSEGRELTPAQAEYFKDSKVRDENGDLKPMYHGSPESFEAFDKKKAKSSGYYGRGFYFTDSESHAGQYGNLYEVYLDIRNPIQEDMYNITREQFTNFVDAVAEDEDYGIDNYGYDATVDSVAESVYGKDDFAMLMDINASCIGDMVAAVKLFNEVNGTDYDGIFASTETVAFYPEQVKDVNNASPTSDPRMKFSLKDSVEDTRDLIAVHNIASSELLKTLDLGGFPMPSIAVVKDTQSHEKYGDVSVLFGKETIDPKASKANKVYGGDAWTPVFPSIDYKVNRDASEEIEKHVESIIGRELMRLMRTPLDYDNMSDALNRWSGNISDAYGNSDGLRYAFLKEKGIDIDVPTKEARLGKRDNSFYVALAEKLGEEKIQKIHMDCFGEYGNKDNVSVIVDIFNEYITEKHKDNPKLVKALHIENDDIGFADFDEMTRGAYKYLNGGIKTEPDVYALSKSVDEYFEENNVKAEYESWLGNLFSGIIESEGIRNDKDMFTPSGNRRSWDSLHMAVTLENVVKAMKKQAEKGAGIAGFGSPFGAAQRNFKSIEDIRANKDRLQRYNEEEYDEIHSEYADRFTEIAGRFAKKDQFGSTIDAGSALIESVAKSNSKEQLDKYLKADSQWFNYSEDITEDLWELVKNIQSMPTEYFEAKPQRAVGFNEIVSVIVPDDVGDEMLSALEENGIEYVMYETGNEQDRTDKVNAQASQKDVKFSFKDGINVSVDDVNEYVNAHPEEFAEIMQYFHSEQQAHHTKQQTVGELKSQLERMKADKKVTRGRVLDPKSIEEDANNLVRMLLSYKEDNTKLTDHKLVKMIQANAKDIFTQLKDGDQESAVMTAYHAAEELVHNLNMANDEMFSVYKELRDYLRNTRVYIPAEYLGDFPDLATFRKEQMGRIRIVNEGSGGVSVDRMYEQLLEMFPGMFDEELSNPADQMYEIRDIRETLDPYEIVLSHEETEQLIKEAAQDILELAVNGKPWKSWADRNREAYDEKVRALKQKHKEAVRDVKIKERERAEKKIEAVRAKSDERLRQAREKGEQKLQEEKQKNKERQQAQRDNRSSREYVSKMEKQISWLSDRLLNPTDDKHLPEGYQKAIAQILCALDTQSERSKKLEEKYGVSQKRLKFLALKEQYEKIADQPDSDILLDEDIANELSNLSELLEDQTIAEATPQQLEQIYRVLRNVTHGIRMVNQAFVEGQRATISEMAESTIEHAESKKRHIDRSGMIGGLDSILNESMVTPRDFFERIGGGIEQAYIGIRKGFDRHVDNITTARTFFEGMFRKYYNKKKPGSTIEKWRDTSTNQTFELDAGGSITLNAAQRMSLYCLMKREQAQGHILGSGIVATEVDVKSKIGQLFGAKMDVKAGTARITWYDIDNILETLTPEQIQIADELMNFLNNECAAWGNEVSMRLYGYEKFTEENYFPIKSADVYLDSKFDGRSSVERIRNFGFTKGTVVNANNPIVIDDIFTVVADHINHMSMYSGFAAPIADFTRVYNYKARAEDGTIVASTKAALQDAYGKKVGSYITKFMSDLQSNTQTRTEGVTRLVNKTLANYKKATIAGNLRVALQQPTAIARAYMLISPKYFTKLNVKKNLQRMKEHCQVARWKGWGHNQVDMARDIDDIMMNNEWTKLDLVTMQIYGALDMVTWSYIWGAVENETKKLHPEVNVDSEEYFRICNERASEIFDKTQVVDSVMHRSEVMRNQDTMSKMVTSFMAEPTRTYNMVRGQYAKALDQWHDGEKGKATATAAKTTYIFLLNAMLCAMAAAVADALRGKDLDDDDEPEEWIEHVLNNFAGNANPLMMIPVLSETVQYWKGWGSQNMALEGMESLITSTKALVDKANGEGDDSWGELIRKEAEAAGLVFGVPVKNILRELETFGKLIGYEASAATKGSEEESVPLLEKLDKLDLLSVEDGSFIDNILNKFGWNLTEAEKAERERRQLIKSYEAKLEGLSGKEREEKLWQLVTRGYTTDLKNGDLQSIRERRIILEEMGGDVALYDERVERNAVNAYKKSIGTDDNVSAILKEFLKTEYGYTDGKISTEVIAKSDVARQYQLAVCYNDDEAAVAALAILIDEGITYEDGYVLDLNRYDAIKAGDYTTGEMSSPVDGRITSTFGYRNAPTAGASSYHEGIDIAAPAGTVVGAADGGKVSSCGYNKTSGYYVKISHGNGRYTEYFHLEGFCVTKGQPVTAGQEIGRVGSTGVSTGPHLHFGVIESGVHVDPTPYLN